MEDESEISKACRCLKEGGVILYPTDTVWGLGCDATDTGAVRRICEIKERTADESKALLVLLPDAAMVSQYTSFHAPLAIEMMKNSGRPLTVIFPLSKNVAPGVAASDGSIGIRIGHDRFTRSLGLMLRHPIVSTSANFKGRPAPVRFEDIDPELIAAADYVVKPSQSETGTGIPSRIVKLLPDGELLVIRE